MAAMMRPTSTAHVDLDGAWAHGILDSYLDCREWGPRVRYCAPPALLDAFLETVRPHLGAFTLFGSGDFHHLSALWLRNLSEPVTLISFDNHPDWDVRPPTWGCGGWINRALELPTITRAVIWGCGNFELKWPLRLFGNRKAIAAGRLQVYPWAERVGAHARRHWTTLTPEGWRTEFSRFAQGLTGQRLYVTVDLDCLRSADAVTNWEPGLLTAADVAWALDELHSAGEVVGGDICGAWSAPRHARLAQSLSSRLDHPRLPARDAAQATRVNERAFRIIWPALTAGYEQYAGADQTYAHP
jgi:hypothetical protein